MSEPSELEYAWSIAEARNERICQVLEDNLALLARVAKLEAALSGLVYRLDEIHEDLAYKAVWTSYMLHGGRYQGPTYVDALAEARAALKDAPQ
jgi:hypothetical protein